MAQLKMEHITVHSYCSMANNCYPSALSSSTAAGALGKSKGQNVVPPKLTTNPGHAVDAKDLMTS
jgi:hypothetical protein